MTTFRLWSVGCLLLLLLPALCSAQALTWEKQVVAGNAGPGPRRDHAVVYDDNFNRVLLFGGKGDGGFKNDVWAYDVLTNGWTEVATQSAVKPEKREGVIMGLDRRRRKVYVMGGQGEGGALFNDVWTLDVGNPPGQEQWTKLAPTGPLPAPRYGHGGGIYVSASDDITRDGTFLMITLGAGKRVRFSDSWIFDLAAESWTRLDTGGDAPGARCLVATAATGPRDTVVFGGCGSGGYGPCPSWQSFRLSNSTWAKMSSCPPRRLLGFMANWNTADEVVMFGGNGGVYGSGNDGFVNLLNHRTGQWRRFQPLGAERPAWRQGGAMVLVYPSNNPSNNNYVLMFGGQNKDRTFNEVWKLSGTVEGQTLPTAGCKSTSDMRVAHAVMMFIAWGVLLPFGMMAARFMKNSTSDKPGREPRWWVIHKWFQPLGIVFTLLGFLLALLMMTVGHFSFLPHAGFGLIIIILAIWQALNACVRPHADPFTKKRKIWQYVHWWSGRVAIVLGWVNIWLGLGGIQASTIIYVEWAIWFAMTLALFVVGCIRKKKSDERVAGRKMGWGEQLNPKIKKSTSQEARSSEYVLMEDDEDFPSDKKPKDVDP